MPVEASAISTKAKRSAPLPDPPPALFVVVAGGVTWVPLEASAEPVGVDVPLDASADPVGVEESEGLADSVGVDDPVGVADSDGLADSVGVDDSVGVADSDGLADSEGDALWVVPTQTWLRLSSPSVSRLSEAAVRVSLGDTGTK